MMEQTNNINSFELTLKNNAIVDNGEGSISFSDGLTITDDSLQWNNTRYDIDSMDLGTYKGQVTADHSMSVREVIGKVTGIAKQGSRVVVDGIKFAVKENALARYAYDMIKGGFLTDFSIETMGPMPDEDGIYRNAQLVGLSLVVMGNNRSAKINEIALNSLESAKNDGLDISYIERILKGGEQQQMNEETLEVQDETVVEDEAVEEEEAAEADEAEEADNGLDAILKAINGLTAKVEKVEKQSFNNRAVEPEFKPAKQENARKSFKNEMGGMGYRERHAVQINAAWDAFKNHSQEAARKLNDVNQYNLEQLQEEGIVSNAITISDMGNFVISKELLADIEGHRSNFQPLLNRVEFKETLSTQMAYLKRSGDIAMSEVEMCDDGADGNLKPISEYNAEIATKNLHELAAVTPVCDAATRFLAVDLLGDVAAGYRNDYDRKRAQLVIARLQQAVNSTGNKISYNGTSDTTTLQSWINTWVEAQEEIMGGIFVFNQKTYGELLRRALGAGISGPLAGLFTTGDQPLIAGSPYIVVPNELLPSLNTAETKSFTVEGTAVTIDQAVFYFDPSTFTGRTSGGLKYDLSTEAAYEVDGSVKSAFQRNELVLRGSFFRNGAVKDEDKVSSLYAAGVS